MGVSHRQSDAPIADRATLKRLGLLVAGRAVRLRCNLIDHADDPIHVPNRKNKSAVEWIRAEFKTPIISSHFRLARGGQLIYMLIHPEVRQAYKDGKLFPARPIANWAGEPRAFFMCRNLHDTVQNGKASLDEDDEILAAWIAEAERRADEHSRGNTTWLPIDQAMSKARAASPLPRATR